MPIKPSIKYKVLRQSADVGGKFYGVVSNANPVPAELAMQQIVEYKKLYNLNPKQLAQIVEDVLQGAAELVARDGLPRNVSSLLKFEARIKGTFANFEAAVTQQKVIVAPRMLKDIRVDIDKNDFTFNNENDNTAPKIFSVVVDHDGWTEWSIAASFEQGGSAVLGEDDYSFSGPIVIAGDRLCPNGWSEDCLITVHVERDGLQLCRLDTVTDSAEHAYGILDGKHSSVASLNAIQIDEFEEEALESNAWTGTPAEPVAYNYIPSADDILYFTFTRTLQDGSGTQVSVRRAELLKP